jgi:hypothetical protein
VGRDGIAIEEDIAKEIKRTMGAEYKNTDSWVAGSGNRMLCRCNVQRRYGATGALTWFEESTVIVDSPPRVWAQPTNRERALI